MTCGEGETITYFDNGRFTDTRILNADDSGTWFTNTSLGRQLLVNDDDITPDSPNAYTYDLTGNELRFVSLGGYIQGVYVRE